MTHPTNHPTLSAATRVGVTGLLLSLLACGGGSSSGDTTPAPAPAPPSFQVTN